MMFAMPLGWMIPTAFGALFVVLAVVSLIAGKFPLLKKRVASRDRAPALFWVGNVLFIVAAAGCAILAFSFFESSRLAEGLAKAKGQQMPENSNPVQPQGGPKVAPKNPPKMPSSPLPIVPVSEERVGDELKLRVKNAGDRLNPAALIVTQGGKKWSFKITMNFGQDSTFYLPLPGQAANEPVSWDFRRLSDLPDRQAAALLPPRTQDVHKQGERE